MRQAYDYWQDQPGSYRSERAREHARPDDTRAAAPDGQRGPTGSCFALNGSQRALRTPTRNESAYQDTAGPTLGIFRFGSKGRDSSAARPPPSGPLTGEGVATVCSGRAAGGVPGHPFHGTSGPARPGRRTGSSGSLVTHTKFSFFPPRPRPGAALVTRLAQWPAASANRPARHDFLGDTRLF